MDNKNKKEILKRLQNDEDYYGDFGKQFLSNSNISTLMDNPLALGNDIIRSNALVIGSYFHVAILEPDKLKKFKIIDATTRNTKVYKELSGGEICLLQHEVDKIDLMIEKVLENDVCTSLIRGNVDYEVPGITEIEGNFWKGKADILNHDDKLIVDLKTTGDINSFAYSAKKYNYDSQAYIYKHIFGYDMVFLVVDKTTHQIGLFDCSEAFYQRGYDKVIAASNIYDLFYKTEDFEPEQFFISKTL
jgi:hypothetical protein|tara:strand:- start:775 stop:1512 length:738 start_codon:yes stop_codon:yes gene_type:complete